MYCLSESCAFLIVEGWKICLETSPVQSPLILLAIENDLTQFSLRHLSHTKHRGTTSSMMIKESLANVSINNNANLASFCTHHPPHEKEYESNISTAGTKESGAGDP